MISFLDIDKQRRAIDELAGANSELKVTLQKLTESKEKYRKLFEVTDQGFGLAEVINDKHGKPYDYRFIEFNHAFGEIMGLPPAKIVGRTARELVPGVEPYRLETLGKVALTGEPAHFEDFIEGLDRYFEVDAYSPEKGYFAHLFRDVSERRKAEQLKDEFIGMISHELRTPLTVFMGAVKVAMTEGITC